jgi:hypothetical protein
MSILFTKALTAAWIDNCNSPQPTTNAIVKTPGSDNRPVNLLRTKSHGCARWHVQGLVYGLA